MRVRHCQSSSSVAAPFSSHSAKNSEPKEDSKKKPEKSNNNNSCKIQLQQIPETDIIEGEKTQQTRKKQRANDKRALYENLSRGAQISKTPVQESKACENENRAVESSGQMADRKCTYSYIYRYLTTCHNSAAYLQSIILWVLCVGGSGFLLFTGVARPSICAWIMCLYVLY